MDDFLMQSQCEESEEYDRAQFAHEYESWLEEVERKHEEQQRQAWEELNK